MPHPLLTATRTTVALADRLSPQLAASLALPLFLRVGKRLPVRPSEQATHDAARHTSMQVNGKRVTVYEWGNGPKTVLLVHGWQGRATQFASMERELRAEGFTVVAFDAPANGASEGRSTQIYDYIDAIQQVERQHGGLHAIVAHSFGALATFAAVHAGVQPERVVAVAGVPDSEFLVQEFCRFLQLSPAATDALRAGFIRRICGGSTEEFERFSTTKNPLPADIPLLLINDEHDRVVPSSAGRAIEAAAIGSVQLLETRGFGHNRVLAADETLDAVTTFLAGAKRPVSA